MMMAVKPNPAITGSFAELGLAVTPEGAAGGDAFMAILAGLNPAPEGEVTDTGPGADLAKQMIAMVTGAIAPAKAAATSVKPEDGEASPDDATDVTAEGATDEATDETTAPPAHPALTIDQPLPTQMAAAQTTQTVSMSLEGSEAAAPAPVPTTPGQAALPAQTATAAPLAAPAAKAMRAEPVIDIAIEGDGSSPTPASTDKPIAPAAALQSLLASPALLRDFAPTARAADATKPEAAPAAPATEPKPASASSFLTSTILPLLPESLHAAVLGQTAPAEAATLTEAAPVDAAQQLVEQQLDLAHEGEWLDQLAKDIARSAGNEGGLRFRLNPENLGSLHVEVMQGTAGASVRLTADTEAARGILADAQPKLVAEARAQGLKIAETHVDLGAGGQQPSGDPRRQSDLEQQQRFIRTAPAAEAEAIEPSRPAAKAAERYA